MQVLMTVSQLESTRRRLQPQTLRMRTKFQPAREQLRSNGSRECCSCLVHLWQMAEFTLPREDSSTEDVASWLQE